MTYTPPLAGIWAALRDTPRRDILYHYTDQDGFLKILAHRYAIATHIRYLNDASEFEHASRTASAWLLERQESSGVDAREAETIASAIEEISELDAFVFCLSAEPNVLSQWRAYGGPTGFAIGFRTDALARQRHAELHPVIYADEDGQRRLIGEMFDAGVTEMRKIRAKTSALHREGRVGGQTEDENYHMLRRGVLSALGRAGPLLKHQDFYEEKEWRLVVRPRNPVTGEWMLEDPIEFRAGRTMPKPWVKLRLNADTAEGWTDEIAEIWVGPTTHQQLAIRAAKLAVERYGLRRCDVKWSRTPYRT